MPGWWRGGDIFAGRTMRLLPTRSIGTVTFALAAMVLARLEQPMNYDIDG